MLTPNQQRFADIYKVKLVDAITKHPDEYGYPASEAEIVVSRMCAAIERGSFCNDSRAIRATCRALGIKSTYAAIKEFWNTPEEVQ